MVKVYLFRKLPALSQMQRDVWQEAVSEVVEPVLGGRTSTIINYGERMDYGSDDLDVMARSFGDLFRHVYTLELTMEVNISIRHVELNGELPESTGDMEGQDHRPSKQHFVATSGDVYAYIERVMRRLPQSRVLFTLNVRQTNIDQSRKVYGKLQFIHFRSDASDSSTSMGALLKLFKALSRSPKSHMRYHNINLTRLLEEVLGSADSTVVINYTEAPMWDTALKAPHCTPESSSVDVWKARYRQMHTKYQSLKDKVLSMELWSSTEQKLQLYELMDGLESDSEEYNEHSSSDTTLETQQVCPVSTQKLLQIRREAELTVEELQALQSRVELLAIKNQRQHLELRKRDEMVRQLHGELIRANAELLQQKLSFQQKLEQYTERFNQLWREQGEMLQSKELQRKQQLSEMLDSYCQEMQSAHQRQLAQKERELQAAQRPPPPQL
ncbi:kinesin heavy chain [Drosophila subobscura]|uniref:kinesin heavy chain n=1 Tax=Drosophila subobscura TaxID=7241 RepID=UPI00155A72F2|nr:kinesin heavy chain [Drosophila subobscura]